MFGPNGPEKKRALYEALTRHNFFPNQKQGVSELPPSVSSRQFTPEVAEALSELPVNRQRRGMGYDLVEYRSTRFNNVPRVLGLCHPRAYASIAQCIHENWDKLLHVTENAISIIKPEFHQTDERLIVMNYEDPTEKVRRSHSAEFAKGYRVQADISNCFGSIYTHAIPWALVGFAEAKINRNNNGLWFNRLDEYQRKCKRNETQGIPVGSAASSILVEAILFSVDQSLEEKGYKHYRYVDDYTCYCKTSDEAQAFIQDLGDLLSEYKLTLNLRKTTIDELPSPIEDSWVLELLAALPSRLSYECDDAQKISTPEALSFINRAILLNQTTPDGSVLKYAFTTIYTHLDEHAPYHVLDCLFNLAWHYPVLIPLIHSLKSKYGISSEPYRNQLNELIIENAKRKRSDGMSWPLHIMLDDGMHCSEEAATEVLKSCDCVATTLLLEMDIYRPQVIELGTVLSGQDEYEKDNHWLLLYQLYHKGLIGSPYNDGVFECLKAYNVNFVPGSVTTDAERECDAIQARIASEVARAVFATIDGEEENAVF